MPNKILIKRFCRLFINQLAPSVSPCLCLKSRASESKSSSYFAQACCLSPSYKSLGIDLRSPYCLRDCLRGYLSSYPSGYLSGYIKYLSKQIILPLLISLTFLLLFCLLFFVPTHAQANTLPNYLQGGGDAFRTLGNFINGALNFITSLLWGIWAIFTALFAKDLMVGADADNIKNQAIKLGAAALVLLSITALPALFAGFAS